MKESFGISEDDTSGRPLDTGATGHIWTADSKDELINAVQKIFTKQGELKVGEICEVKDVDATCWKERRLFAILPDICKHRYIASCGISQYNWSAWDLARPIAKKIEPTIDGDIYTWEM